MRHFLPDLVEPEVLARLLKAAHQAGSVGLMQPWRFIRITDNALREMEKYNHPIEVKPYVNIFILMVEVLI